MTPTARLHFLYIVGILGAIIVCLMTVKLGDNEQVVSYFSFALTLASILLAVVATVYAFVSNASLAQSIGGMVRAAGDVRSSSASLKQLARNLEVKVGSVTETVVATHELVRNLSNPTTVTQKPAAERQVVAGEVLGSLVSRSSNSGIASMYAASLAFRTKKPFQRDKLFEVLGRGNEDYYWGWLMACDAAQLIDVRTGPDETWTITSFQPGLLQAVEEAAKEAPEAEADDWEGAWSRRKVAQLNAYFGAAVVPAPSKGSGEGSPE